ncbi:MAG: Ig-like domain-containing protein, partial [Atopobiaceae bacterium]|nr:Ig-like domain-containing protein [Atopobiaceae bacterium]
MSSVVHRVRWRGRLLLGAVVALAMCLAIVGEAHAATKTAKATLYFDSATQAAKTLKASGLTAKKATWTTSNKSVVTITKAGKATAKKAGKATITAKQGKNTWKFVVTSKKVGISKTKATLYVGKTLQLKLTGDTIKKVASSKTSLATVSKAGKVTAKKAGKVTITITSKKGKAYKCVVTVKNVAVTKVAFKKTSLTFTVGDAAKSNPATVSPSNATLKTVTYKSSNTKVAKVDSKGKVTPVAAGKATITATAGGKSATCKVTVKAPTREVTFGASVTDAGQYVDRMMIDYGEGNISGLTNDTFTVKMTSTVDYGQ